MTESDTETEKYLNAREFEINIICMKLVRSVHTDQDPLIIEFHGIGSSVGVGLCKLTITRKIPYQFRN